VDAAGNVFIADGHNIVLRMDAKTGVLAVLAGNGTVGYTGDGGPATSAELNGPWGVAVDAAGNLYIADVSNNCVRKVSNGVITTVAGNGTAGYTGDGGPATSAQLNNPYGVAVDSASGNLYIADYLNHTIRKVSNGVITTVAGTGTAGYSGDSGPATSAQLYRPQSVVLDSGGNLYIADSYNNRIREISNGVITTVAGTGTAGYTGDSGPAASARLNRPEGVALDSAGNLYIADYNNYRVREVSNGVIATVAGSGVWGYGGDNGPAIAAQLYLPTGVAVDSAGNLYIADRSNNRIREVSNGVIGTVAGGGLVLGDNGPATSAQLYLPAGVAVDSAGSLYIADSLNNLIRKVSNGVITTVAGNGTPGYSGDNGPATSAQLNGPTAVALDAAGNLYIADYTNCIIRKVSGGVITTVAGNGTGAITGKSGDNGPATSAQLNGPSSIAVDAAGNLYIADSLNNRIRKVSNGIITTVAGTGTEGFLGDNGPATSAWLDSPFGVALDAAGNLYIADTVNVRIRKISNGVITTVAGTGGWGYSGDNGPATSALLNYPFSLTVDSLGHVYFADDWSNCIRELSNGVITTVAGNGTPGFSGDNGPATSAQLNHPSGVAVDLSGNVFIADYSNNRIRILTAAASPIIAGVFNAASGQAAIAPNTWVSIYGSNFAPAGFSDDWSKSIVNGNLPTTLDGISVSVGGIPAYVNYVGSGQINILTPNVAAGNASITVTTATATTTAPVTVTAQQFSPAFFPWPNGQPAATHLDYSWACKNGTFGATTVPAKPGEYIILWGTGFGPTTPTAPVGVTIPLSPTYNAANPVSVTIGNTPASVYGTALASGFGGLYQVVALVPATLTNGDYALVATVGGVASASTTLTVHN
jgi:uncharacterized protein (TIGR03437 family)